MSQECETIRRCVAKSEANKGKKTSKFIEKLPHYVTRCEHKSCSDENRDVNYEHIALLIQNLF